MQKNNLNLGFQEKKTTFADKWQKWPKILVITHETGHC
jgi:hypothetical protein